MRPVKSFFLSITLLLLTLLPSLSAAAKQPTSYCKCICFQNSTIIPLNSPPSESSSPSSKARLFHRADDSSEEKPTEHHHTLSCNDCNRAFCLDYNLPICKNAKEEDVFAQCFQRDSLKDRMIVTLFIVATASLLGWAIVKPWVVKSGVSDVVQKYTPLSAREGNDDSTGLPRPNGAAGYGSDAEGIGSSGSGRPGRGGSISRQGGLNS